jgi:hypothetical protein
MASPRRASACASPSIPTAPDRGAIALQAPQGIGHRLLVSCPNSLSCSAAAPE